MVFDPIWRAFFQYQDAHGKDLQGFHLFCDIFRLIRDLFFPYLLLMDEYSTSFFSATRFLHLIFAGNVASLHRELGCAQDLFPQDEQWRRQKEYDNLPKESYSLSVQHERNPHRLTPHFPVKFFSQKFFRSLVSTFLEKEPFPHP